MLANEIEYFKGSSLLGIYYQLFKYALYLAFIYLMAKKLSEWFVDEEEDTNPPLKKNQRPNLHKGLIGSSHNSPTSNEVVSSSKDKVMDNEERVTWKEMYDAMLDTYQNKHPTPGLSKLQQMLMISTMMRFKSFLVNIIVSIIVVTSEVDSEEIEEESVSPRRKSIQKKLRSIVMKCFSLS